jgi:glycosyltransferase involved in cell wall biosynthesis
VTRAQETKVKVLLANKFFFRNGGSEAVMFQERDFLLKAGCAVIDFSMQDGRNAPSAYSEYFVANQSYETATGAGAKARAALKLIHSPEAVRKIGQLIERTEPDLVHCHNIYHQLTPSIIRAAKRRGVPVVLTLHDYKPICPVYTRLRHGRVCSDCIGGRFSNVVKHRCANGSLGKSALLLAEAWMQRLLGSYDEVDRMVAPSHFMRQSVTQHRFPANRVDVIYNGIDCGAMAPTSDDRGYILYLGRLSPEKGIETLLAAHNGIADRVPLMVAGTGPIETALRTRFPRAQYLGHLSGPALDDAIRHAALLAVPSEWYENCPMSILEAMAFGKPVVASDIGGIPELVLHAKTGLLFRPGDTTALKDCLVCLMDDPILRRRYGNAARARAENQFSLEKHNSALLQLYLTVTQGSRVQLKRGASRRLATPQE